MMPSPTHLVIIPSYNTGAKLVQTVHEAVSQWQPVWVIIDGSTDGSDRGLASVNVPEGNLRVLRLPKNLGKGAAVLEAFRLAAEAGFHYALVMDADGQHPSGKIGFFMKLSMRNPEAMIIGVPVFGPDAPPARRHGRRAGNWWVSFETLWGGIGDSLFGFRVYPIEATLKVFEKRRSGLRYDFDTVAVVRLFRHGVVPVNVPAPVRYLSEEEGGVSHFSYWRDNILLIFRHACLVAELLICWPSVLRCRRRARAYSASRPLTDLLAPLDGEPNQANTSFHK